MRKSEQESLRGAGKVAPPKSALWTELGLISFNTFDCVGALPLAACFGGTDDMEESANCVELLPLSNSDSLEAEKCSCTSDSSDSDSDAETATHKWEFEIIWQQRE